MKEFFRIGLLSLVRFFSSTPFQVLLSCRLMLFAYLLYALPLQGQSASESGTIIVTYQTEELAGTCLDRIRFWLINAQGERTLYPKKDEFVANSQEPNERTVVITKLTAGSYRIEFLVPNVERAFEEVSPRIVSLPAGAVVKIDQAIRLRVQTGPTA